MCLEHCSVLSFCTINSIRASGTPSFAVNFPNLSTCTRGRPVPEGDPRALAPLDVSYNYSAISQTDTYYPGPSRPPHTQDSIRIGDFMFAAHGEYGRFSVAGLPASEIRVSYTPRVIGGYLGRVEVRPLLAAQQRQGMYVEVVVHSGCEASEIDPRELYVRPRGKVRLDRGLFGLIGVLRS